MKKVIGFIVLVFISALCAIGQTKPEPTRTDFSGTWVLDLVKTKNLPKELESYVVKVVEGDKKIGIKTEVKGDIQLRRGSRGGGSSESGGENSGGEQSGRGGRGGRGGGGGGNGGGFGGGESLTGRIALSNYASEVIFNLSEEEIVIDMKDGDKVTGKAKLKTKWKKDGKVLETTITKEFERNGQKLSVPTQEKWELDDEGKTLKISRNVSFPTGSDSINLVFTKQS